MNLQRAGEANECFTLGFLVCLSVIANDGRAKPESLFYLWNFKFHQAMCAKLLQNLDILKRIALEMKAMRTNTIDAAGNGSDIAPYLLRLETELLDGIRD